MYSWLRVENDRELECGVWGSVGERGGARRKNVVGCECFFRRHGIILFDFFGTVFVPILKGGHIQP